MIGKCTVLYSTDFPTCTQSIGVAQSGKLVVNCRSRVAKVQVDTVMVKMVLYMSPSQLSTYATSTCRVCLHTASPQSSFRAGSTQNQRFVGFAVP